VLLCAEAIAHAADAPAETDGGATVHVQILDWERTQHLIAQHKGQVVLVDIWTTTCPACVEKFPEFVALQQQHGAAGLACISVNCDYDGVPDKPPGHYRPKVEKFLQEQQAEFDHVLLSVPFADFLEQIELGTTPAYLLYDADGRLVRRFDNDEALKEEDEFTMAEIAAAVEELLANRGAGGTASPAAPR
jgi:thiol-disulfide isomerase/thioredoxin